MSDEAGCFAGCFQVVLQVVLGCFAGYFSGCFAGEMYADSDSLHVHTAIFSTEKKSLFSY
jgi:hypothetical protein